MNTVLRARRIAIGAAFGGGGVGLVGAALTGVLLGQARQARRVIGPPETHPPSADGLYDGDLPGRPLTLGLLGDSSMAGYGVDRVEETPGALFGAGLAALADRPVRIVSAARVGARSADLDAQADVVLPHRPDAVAVFVGANDVTHRVRPAVAVDRLGRAVRRIVGEGVVVVVGTCPDLGTIEPLHQPLRWVARQWSRGLAAAQTVAVVEAGGRTVSLGDLLGPEFAAHPREMFSADRFHPSATGYARAVHAMLPSLAAALGQGPDPDSRPRADRGEAVLSLPEAALEAAGAAGTEVSAVEPTTRGQARPGGPDARPGGWRRWVQLRRRVRMLGEEAIVDGRPATGAAAADTVADAPGRAEVDGYDAGAAEVDLSGGTADVNPGDPADVDLGGRAVGIHPHPTDGDGHDRGPAGVGGPVGGYPGEEDGRGRHAGAGSGPGSRGTRGTT